MFVDLSNVGFFLIQKPMKEWLNEIIKIKYM